eukprot:1162020-Pelagomonas_calceolata.AAC.9
MILSDEKGFKSWAYSIIGKCGEAGYREVQTASYIDYFKLNNPLISSPIHERKMLSKVSLTITAHMEWSSQARWCPMQRAMGVFTAYIVFLFFSSYKLNCQLNPCLTVPNHPGAAKCELWNAEAASKQNSRRAMEKFIEVTGAGAAAPPAGPEMSSPKTTGDHVALLGHGNGYLLGTRAIVNERQKVLM